jgi:hypothetical protein
MLVWGGGLIKLFNAKISPNYLVFTFTKETKVKIYFDIIKVIIIFCDFFQSCIINHFYYCMIHVVKQIYY